MNHCLQMSRHARTAMAEYSSSTMLPRPHPGNGPHQSASARGRCFSCHTWTATKGDHSVIVLRVSAVRAKPAVESGLRIPQRQHPWQTCYPEEDAQVRALAKKEQSARLLPPSLRCRHRLWRLPLWTKWVITT